jgi:hypothetical protein
MASPPSGIRIDGARPAVNRVDGSAGGAAGTRLTPSTASGTTPDGGRHVRPQDCTLFSGAARGAEAAFGEAAERHGVEEVNFTFQGHHDARTRGLRVLSEVELQKGDVSLAYVSRLMHRRYPDTPLFRKVLQSIWHQVNEGREVFLVGKIQDDDTVVGGTGVSAEYAKFFNKPCHVFDQDRDGWFRWTGERWEAERDPVISQPRFTGTGTRFLRDNGRAAVDALFQRTFEPR